MGAMKKAAFDGFKKLGLEPYKDTIGEGFDVTLGILIDKNRQLKPEPQKFFPLWEATLYATNVATMSAKQLHRLIGMWTWHLGIMRK